MSNHWDPFAELTLRPTESLTADERASLVSFLAADDELLGGAVNTKARRWARSARLVGRHAQDLGRLPREGDPDVDPDLMTWVGAQRRADLNSYERACVEAMPGWVYAD